MPEADWDLIIGVNLTGTALMCQAAIPAILRSSGNIVNIAAPNAQMQRPEGLEDGQGRKEWPLRLVPLPTTSTAADQWMMTLT